MSIAENVRRDGYCRIEAPWSGAAAYLNCITAKATYGGHVVASGDGVPYKLEDSLRHLYVRNAEFSCHTMEAALSVPGLLDFILPMTEIAAEYFEGERPLLYSVNSFWRKPTSTPGWHFDLDDRKILVMFLYGTDILTKEDGPHAYLRGTHLWSEEAKDALHQSGAAPCEDLVETFYGPAGTHFFTDTRGLHNGFSPVEKPRLLTWARWGVSNPPASYIWDKLAPVPASRLPIDPAQYGQNTKAATRLIIDWNA